MLYQLRAISRTFPFAQTANCFFSSPVKTNIVYKEQIERNLLETIRFHLYYNNNAQLVDTNRQ